MAKIPFDIKFRPQIESGEYKVSTAKEQPVRIICWDRSTTYWKIIALVLAPDGKTENPFTYDVEGKESDGCLHNHELDLFLITQEPELTAFENRLCEILDFAWKHKDITKTDDDIINDAKRLGTELLAIARKEIEKGLPRWVKVDEGDMLDKYSKYLLRSNEGCYYYCCGTTITRDGYMLLVDNLEKLPKDGEI